MTRNADPTLIYPPVEAADVADTETRLEAAEATILAGTTVPEGSALVNAPAYSATVTLALNTHDLHEIGVMTGNLTIAVTGQSAGRKGSIVVRQPSSSSTKTVTFTAPATYTIVTASANLTAATGNDVMTRYDYLLFASGGVNYMQIEKILPV